MTLKALSSLIFFVLFASLFAQNRHLDLGLKNNGICLGNSANYNGVRLNLWDNNVGIINGINISGYSNCKRTNGISIGVSVSEDSISNGVKIAGLMSYSGRHNGLALAGILCDFKRLNGVAISGFGCFGDTLNGLAVTLGIISAPKQQINGIAIAAFNVYSQKLNGVSLSIFANSFERVNGISFALLNRTKELHGFQFGLINYAGNNCKFFRWTPLFNLHL